MVRSTKVATAALMGLLTSGGLIGCSHDRELPPGDAVILEQDKGVSTDRMMATVRRPGTIYVYDESDKRVVYTGPVQAGDSVSVDTFKDEVRVENRTVAQPELDDAHRYQIYFDEDPRARVAGDEVYRREVRTETQVQPAPAPAPRYNPDGTVIRRETTETQVQPAPGTVTPPPAPDGTVIRKETTETQVQPAPTPPPSDGSVIRREETEIRREPAR